MVQLRVALARIGLARIYTYTRVLSTFFHFWYGYSCLGARSSLFIDKYTQNQYSSTSIYVQTKEKFVGDISDYATFRRYIRGTLREPGTSQAPSNERPLRYSILEIVLGVVEYAFLVCIQYAQQRDVPGQLVNNNTTIVARVSNRFYFYFHFNVRLLTFVHNIAFSTSTTRPTTPTNKHKDHNGESSSTVAGQRAQRQNGRGGPNGHR